MWTEDVEVTEGFKQTTADNVYIMPDGNVSYLAKDNENCEYKGTRKYYIDENDAKKRLSLTNIEVLDPDSGHSNFKTHTLIYQYTSVPKFAVPPL